MTVRRIMGIETEYGVLQPGRPLANPMLLSSHVVAVHAAAREGARAKARWDYDDEDPLKDARGFHLQRAAAHPSLLTDDPSRPAPSAEGTQLLPRTTVEEYEDPGAANVVLTNGARLYVDHAHPEYSSPEVTNPLDVVRWDRAGQLVMLRFLVAALAALPFALATKEARALFRSPALLAGGVLYGLAFQIQFEGLALPRMRQQRFGRGEVLECKVGGVAVVAGEQHVRHFGPGLHGIHQVVRRNAVPVVVVARP